MCCKSAIRSALGLSILCWPLGCSQSDAPRLGTVSGVVTLDGEPLGNVVVSFEPETGHASSGATDKNGHYELGYLKDIKGAEIGLHTVRIRRDEFLDNMVSQTAGEDAKELTPVPDEYNSKSTLKADVKPGDNTFDFPLKSG